jgi:poly-beta-1,6-N-acetyl-D-glucosamine synthase
MWAIPSALYWSSLGCLGYTYVGYPAMIYLLSRLRTRTVRRAPIEPTVSVVVAAFNEGASIARKLDNLLALDYPREKVQIIVVSDGSTDGTEAIVEGYRERQVELLKLPHAGKPTAINEGVEHARGEVVVFCDARQSFSADALRVMAEFFADAQVGAVVGELQLEATRGPGVYWAYEKLIREAEGRFDSVVGGSGCFLAIRRHLFVRIPADSLLDDMYTPLQIVLQGYRVLHRPEIKVYDQEASISGEFSRKARTLVGNFQLVQHLPQLLHPLKNRLFVQFVSHKLLRLACPYALATLLASNVVLVVTFAPPWPLYVMTLAGQVLGYGLALRGALEGEKAGRLARVSHTFVTLNLAAVEGLRRYLQGNLAWTTMKRGASDAS